MRSGKRKTVDNEAVKTMVLKMEDLVDNMVKETIPEAVIASHATQVDTVTTTEAEEESTEPKETQSHDSSDLEEGNEDNEQDIKAVGNLHRKEIWIY